MPSLCLSPDGSSPTNIINPPICRLARIIRPPKLGGGLGHANAVVPVVPPVVSDLAGHFLEGESAQHPESSDCFGAILLKRQLPCLACCKISAWAGGGKQTLQPPVFRGLEGGGLQSIRYETYDFYWQASQSGSSIAQAFGTGAGPAGAASTESSPWLPLETALSLPVLMVDFSVLVAARARR